jgi:MoxR-like ATPase
MSKTKIAKAYAKKHGIPFVEIPMKKVRASEVFFTEDVFAHAPLHVQLELSALLKKRMKGE